MRTSIVRVMVYASILMMMLGQSSCAPATITMPPEYLTREPATPTIATPSISASSTSIPTAISTFTPAINTTNTLTPTPAGTPTQLPELGTPAAGKGTVTGLVLWNGQPVPQAAVWLCQEFQGNCKGPDQFRVNTDAQGYYVMKNVTPGKYIVAINSFNTGWFIFYVDRNGTREQTVAADQNLILDPFNIWQFNLRSTNPKSNKILTEANPTFTWEAYPDAAYYQISILDANAKPIVDAHRVDELTFTPTEPLVSCKYSWQVDAFNEQGIKIASTSPRNTNFSVINVPGQC